jgi:hypothetical protein
MRTQPKPESQPPETGAMNLRLSLDRFEGDKKNIAVLLTDDGTSINLPKRFLPRNARAGDILAVTIARDAAATKQVAVSTRAVQDELKKTDPGGDIKI